LVSEYLELLFLFCISVQLVVIIIQLADMRHMLQGFYPPELAEPGEPGPGEWTAAGQSGELSGAGGRAVAAERLQLLRRIKELEQGGATAAEIAARLGLARDEVRLMLKKFPPLP